jgi:hypothetical protein
VAGYGSQNGDHNLGAYYRTAVFYCAFLWAKRSNAKDINKEMFPVKSGKYWARKAVHNWNEKFSQGRFKVAVDARAGAEVAETTVKNFYAAGFDALVKRWDKCSNLDGGYFNK